MTLGGESRGGWVDGQREDFYFRHRANPAHSQPAEETMKIREEGCEGDRRPQARDFREGEKNLIWKDK